MLVEPSKVVFLDDFLSILISLYTWGLRHGENTWPRCGLRLDVYKRQPLNWMKSTVMSL